MAAAVAGPVLAVAVVGPPAGGADAQCEGARRTVDVVVTPEVADVVRAVADRLDRRDASRGVCRRTVVTSQESDTQALHLRSGRARPAVWIPDSSLWLERAATVGARLAGEHPSIAQTPVVFAVRRALAGSLGSGGGLSGLVASATSSPVRLGWPDPARSAATAGALLELKAAVAAQASGGAGLRVALAATLRQADRTLVGEPSALLAAVAGTEGPAAVAVPERAVRLHNAKATAPVVALYPQRDRFVLDYPVVAMSRDRRVGAEARRILDGLRSPAGQRLVRAAGFRTASDGHPPQSNADAEDALRAYLAITRSFRMLAVIDVSGSMGQVVPGAGGATRIDLARAAAAGALPLLPPDSRVGLWEFASELTAGSDHRELVPIGPVATSSGGAAAGGTALALAVAGLRHIDGGGTGLYDTTLAAVRAVRAGWDPDRVNSVVLLTDGRNDEVQGLDLPGLIAALGDEDDPSRPVPVIGIVYGPDGDATALAAISEATGGETYVARDPRRIDEVLLEAVGRRPCRPSC